jgi:hypothetical protein
MPEGHWAHPEFMREQQMNMPVFLGFFTLDSVVAA